MWAEPVSLGLVKYGICVGMIELSILVVCVILVYYGLVMECGRGPYLLDSGVWARPVSPSCSLYDCMECGIMGELTKIRAYSFQFWFQVPLLRRGRSWRGSGPSHTCLVFRTMRSSWEFVL